MIFNSIDFTASSGLSVVRFDLIGPSGPGPIAAAPDFKDAIGNEPVGIAIVASLPITQNQQFVANPDINLVSIIKPIDTITGWTSANQIEFTVDPIGDYSTRKLGYEIDDVIQFKAYLVGQNGMTQPLNAVKAIAI